jgi:acetyl esterase/lipase
LIGWREDFNMAYQTRVPGQIAAEYYLTRAAQATDKPLRVTGHSKGGNLAVYAAASVAPEVQDRIMSLQVYDAPGMNREISSGEGYGRIRDKIRSYIPQTSIIGLLMDYYEPYTVVRSTASGISQHDPMTWKVYGPRFETLASVDQTAIVVRDTLHEWLQNSTPEQRAAFVDALFGMVETTKATRMSELTGEKLRSMLTMVGNRKEVDPETRRVFTRLMAQAVTLGFGNVIDWVRGRRDNDIAGGWETMSPEKRREMLDAAMNSQQPGDEPDKDQSREQKDP